MLGVRRSAQAAPGTRGRAQLNPPPVPLWGLEGLRPEEERELPRSDVGEGWWWLKSVGRAAEGPSGASPPQVPSPSWALSPHLTSFNPP